MKIKVEVVEIPLGIYCVKLCTVCKKSTKQIALDKGVYLCTKCYNLNGGLVYAEK